VAASYPTTTFAGLAGLGDIVVLDVRLSDEWRQAHIAGAFHIPLHELEGRIAELDDEPVAVHCASGYRAGIAASILQRAGRDVVLVDDDWANAAKAIGPRFIVASRPA
jgi:hydroxyacylglutathione hydrolase